VTRVEKALEKGEIAVVLFMDMSAAFSTANVEGLINNLESTGVNKNILQWTNDMLCNRKVIASLNGTEIEQEAPRGCPQVGILSGPVLWNGDMRNLTKRFPKKHSTYRGIYADDIFNIGTGICVMTCANNLQQDIKIMEEWAKEHGLSFNVNKTKLMLFTNRRNIRKPDIFLYGKKIEWVSEMKYLGVLIDDKLNWLPHVKKAAQKATFTMLQCRRMVGKTWGLKPKINRWLYVTLVRPILAYGCLSWIKSTETKSHMKHLEKVQRRACVATLNCIHTTPTDGMQAMLNMEPIHIYLQAQALNTYRRLKVNGNWVPKEGEVVGQKLHSNIIKRLAREIPLINQPRDRLINTEYLKTDFTTIIASREEVNMVLKKPRPTEPNTIYVFTDGSKNNQSSGSGWSIMGDCETNQSYINLGKIQLFIKLKSKL